MGCVLDALRFFLILWCSILPFGRFIIKQTLLVMKNQWWKMAMLPLLLAMFVACSDDEDYEDYIWDFINPSVMLFVTDEVTGADLCDPSVAGNVVESAYVAYQGKSYPLLPPGVIYEEEMEQTRETCPLPIAFRHARLYSDGQWFVSFGEFAPSDYQGETFEVFWGDGTSTEISFDLVLEWDKKHYPHIQDEVWVDGISNGSGYGEGWRVHLVK